MYTPSFNRIDDEDEIRRFVAEARSAQFITVDPDGTPVATLLPVIWDGDVVLAHMARANPQWKTIAPDSPALLICSGPEAYISPSWYAAKAEHGRVVPTWNYSAVHLSGTVRVREDRDWLRDVVTHLTSVHEDGRDEPWHPGDAPEKYIEGQLAGIVGLEITVSRVEGKAKLSQNRSAADRRGVVDGLRAEPHYAAAEVAAAMEPGL
ncbi:transcriptional regulator [Mycolicibacterium moriokaense]|uniref:Transcriptional regulator n=1 Tax=Mycolicibacterium moriokaense TaxID=39691 RepID=A0AAD1HC46_9MYCO|nr:FMN-binding negative transcriptional regulator [Mycolicibacterium moriokaense]MCV7038177.1 FMN-binding negative transcriptional regulator [Mycolicibacterium moriokaense]ORB24175.1 transcriptional regulator [Mycolicibacterium moriokaense]BBX02707.1 transcriptional regulator [Mycolicibacterium moriokaense]